MHRSANAPVYKHSSHPPPPLPAPPLSRFLERIVNIITVRRAGNLDRCKTTKQSSVPAVVHVAKRLRIYAYMYVYSTFIRARARTRADTFGCKRLANETFRFTKSRPGSSYANRAVNPRDRMLISLTPSPPCLF